MTQSKIEKPKRKMKPGGGKSKGNGFESVICKKLSALLLPMEFKRSQGSGNVLGGKNIKNIEKFSDEIKTIFIGDVCPTNESDVIKEHNWKFRFTIECKFYKSVDTLQQLFNNSKVFGWFDQATEDSNKLKKEPLLIFKFNHTDIFVALDNRTKLPTNFEGSIINIKNKKYNFNIVLLEELSKHIEWWKTYI